MRQGGAGARKMPELFWCQARILSLCDDLRTIQCRLENKIRGDVTLNNRSGGEGCCEDVLVCVSLIM